MEKRNRLVDAKRERKHKIFKKGHKLYMVTGGEKESFEAIPEATAEFLREARNRVQRAPLNTII